MFVKEIEIMQKFTSGILEGGQKRKDLFPLRLFSLVLRNSQTRQSEQSKNGKLFGEYFSS